MELPMSSLLLADAPPAVFYDVDPPVRRHRVDLGGAPGWTPAGPLVCSHHTRWEECGCCGTVGVLLTTPGTLRSHSLPKEHLPTLLRAVVQPETAGWEWDPYARAPQCPTAAVSVVAGWLCLLDDQEGGYPLAPLGLVCRLTTYLCAMYTSHAVADDDEVTFSCYRAPDDRPTPEDACLARFVARLSPPHPGRLGPRG